MLHAKINSFGELAHSQRGAHALTQFAKGAFGKIALNRFTELGEGSLFANGDHEQQALCCTGSCSRVPLACKLAGEVEDVLITSASYRSEEHTSELQSLRHLVCRLLLEKKKELRRSIV